jgi:site-specific recombinase XerD
VILESFVFHLRARNLSPRTIKATEEYLRPFLVRHDPLTATPRNIEAYLAELAARCTPATVATAWRHLRGLFRWLHQEGDLERDPMEGIPKPIVPPTEVPIPSITQIRALLQVCSGRTAADRRDYALITIMLDTGLRLSEVTNLTMDDISEDHTIRVFGKGRKWRTVQLGTTSSRALSRWLRIRRSDTNRVWIGRKGPLTASGVRRIIRLRGRQASIALHPHMLRHSFVDTWLRNGGNEIDLARLCGWTTTRMASHYAQFRAEDRARSAHRMVQPLDRLHRPSPRYNASGFQ